MPVNHRLLHRVQAAFATAQAFDRDQFLAIERRQELYAGIDGAHHKPFARCIDLRERYGARPAIAFRATFLRPDAAQILAKELQHGARRIDVFDLDHLAIENEPYS